MHKWLTLVLLCLPFIIFAQPCNLTDASGCDCMDGSNDCDLLPDIGIARDLLTSPFDNSEYPGQLAVSVSTPNIGHGPLRVIPTDYFICGTDTIYSPGGLTGTCPDGSDPRQLIRQRIYHKNADGSMTYSDRDAGSMTYHASHGHMHVDDWGVYTLRTEVPGTDPLTWPIIAEGAKLGFCLMDFGSCASYYGHCRDSSGSILTTNAPNMGLGGGTYSCGSSNQGISCGFTDIYDQMLDGMQIDLPPSVCNGDYMVVVQIDPNDNFLEEDEDNNVEVVPITLTQQGTGNISVQADGPADFCVGETVTLSIDDPTATLHLWSTGETTPTITVSTSGTYSCTAITGCGPRTTPDFVVNVLAPGSPLAADDTTCGPGFVNLSATATGTGSTLQWHDAPVGGSLVSTGTNYVTPSISSTTSYYVSEILSTPGASGYVGEPTHSGGSNYHGISFNAYLVFDVHKEVYLKSVKTITNLAGYRTIELRDASGNVLQMTRVFVDTGETRTPVNFLLSPGMDYRLGTNTDSNQVEFGVNTPSFKRTSGGTSYPYTFEDIITVTTTQYGPSYWYYFYDWELEEPDLVCEGPRVEVQAVVDNSCTSLCETPQNPTNLAVGPNSVTVYWDPVPNATQYQIFGKLASGATWQSVINGSNVRTVNILNPNKNYVWYVRAKCPGPILSGNSDTTLFTTPSAKLGEAEIAFDLYPNPAAAEVTLRIQDGGSQDLTYSISDNLGRSIETGVLGELNAGEQRQIPVNALPDGVYLLRLSNGFKEWTERLVIQH